jgi:hypothetical protein
MSEERWGGFILTDNPAYEPRIEAPAPRADFPWAHGDGYWDNRFAKHYASIDEAARDARVPLPSYVPNTHKFLAAVVLDDGFGAADSSVAFLEPDRRTIQLSRGDSRAAAGPDGSLNVAWSLRFPRPLPRLVHSRPIALSAPSVNDAAFVEDSIEKIHVAGNEGVLRLVSSRGGVDLYGMRIPQVVLQWFDGPTLFAVTGYGDPAVLTRVAESMRPVTIAP